MYYYCTIKKAFILKVCKLLYVIGVEVVTGDLVSFDLPSSGFQVDGFSSRHSIAVYIAEVCAATVAMNQVQLALLDEQISCLVRSPPELLQPREKKANLVD